jgi:hypothetical protein
MTDPDLNLKPGLERLGDRVQPRSDAFDRLDHMRARRARGRSLGSIALAFVVAVAGTWGAFAAFRSTGAQPAGDPAPVIDSPCPSDQTTTVEVVVGADLGLNADCWNVPADTPVTIAFDNRKAPVPAIVTIASVDSCPFQPSNFEVVGCDGSKLFTTELIKGTQTTLDVPPMVPGSYQLWDAIHPAMHATLYVGQGPFPTATAAVAVSPGLSLETCDGISAPHAQIQFQDLAWDLTCWNAPAGHPLVIHYQNGSDGVPSGLAIVPADTCQASIVFGNATSCAHQDLLTFDGSIETGPGESTYEIGELPAGTYVMYDPVHPVSAHATLIVD